jgi:hypothetical protein
MMQEKYNEDLLRRVVKEVVNYVFQNRDKFEIYDGSVLKLTNAEIKRIIEDKYGSEIWNRLPCSAKLYNELRLEAWRRNYLAIKKPSKRRVRKWRMYLVPVNRVSEFLVLLR